MTKSYTVKIAINQLDDFVDFLDDYREETDYVLEPVPHPHRVAIEGLIRKRWADGRPSSPLLRMKLNAVDQWSEDEVRIVWKNEVGAVAFVLRFKDHLGFRDEPKPLAVIPMSLRAMMAKGEA